MTLHLADEMYAASAAVAMHGPEIQSTSDPAGHAFVQHVRGFRRLAGIENPELWGDMFQLAGFVQWRRVFDPLFPSTSNDRELLKALGLELASLVNRVGTEIASKLDAILEASDALLLTGNPLSTLLRDNLVEVGLEDVVVLTLRGRIRQRVEEWLTEEFSEHDIAVSVAGVIGARVFGQAYAVGRPDAFPHRTLTAPTATQIAFLIPDWVRSRSLPESPFVGIADNAIAPRSWGQVEAPRPASTDVIELEPPMETFWAGRNMPDDERYMAKPGEAIREARRVLLAGGRFAYLEVHGDSIRQFFPDIPAGERVGNGRVSVLAAGDFLILRDDAERPDSLYVEAVESLGDSALAILACQRRWKSALQAKIDALGSDEVKRQLRNRGVRHAAQSTHWVEEELSRPQRVADFRLVLDWLSLDIDSHVEAASSLWRERNAVGRRMTRELERAAASVDVEKLEADGSVIVSLPDSARPMVIARVLDLAETTQEIAARNCRRLFTLQGSAKWSE